MKNKNIGCACVKRNEKMLVKKYGKGSEITSKKLIQVSSPGYTKGFGDLGFFVEPAHITIRFPIPGKDGKPTKKFTTGFLRAKFCPLCGMDYDATKANSRTKARPK